MKKGENNLTNNEAEELRILALEAQAYEKRMCAIPVDYTQWQKTIFSDIDVHELSKRAMQTRKDRKSWHSNEERQEEKYAFMITFPQNTSSPAA